MFATVRLSILYGIVLGAVFTAIFLIFGVQLSAIFLHEAALIQQTAFFLRILCLSAPLVSIINMVTSYFQALGKALRSLTITILRNVVLFVPAVVVLNHYWQLSGVIAAQPLVEAILTVICIILYLHEKQLEEHPTVAQTKQRPSVQHS